MKIVTHASQEPVVVAPDGTERRILSYGGKLMLVQFRFAAGITSARHSHPHEQIGYIVSGEIDFVIEMPDGLQTTRLTAGGSYYIPANVRHNIVTYAPTILVDCFTPIREDFLSW